MRFVSFFSLFLASALLHSACEEIPPQIGDCQTARVVLVEEFTGVRCVNCPAGSAKIEQLLEQYTGAKLIAVSIHAGFFSVPYPESVEDFTTTAGNDIDALLGPVTAYPAASVNRKLFPQETQRPLSLASWAGYIASELCRAPEVALTLSAQYDTASRQISATISASSLDASTVFDQPLGITLYLLEDGVRSAQLDAGGIDNDYIHKHILRHCFTPSNGAPIHNGGASATLAPVTRTYTHTLPANQVPENCQLVGFIHYKGNNNRFDVLQAAEISLIE